MRKESGAHHKIEVLVAEDNPGDLHIIRKSFESSGLSVNLSTVSDGEQAEDFLHRRGRFTGSCSPDIVFLDLNLPRRSGLDVLVSMRSHEHLRDVPVIILSGSSDDRDVKRCYGNRANAYITKSLALDEYVNSIKGALEEWSPGSELPRRA